MNVVNINVLGRLDGQHEHTITGLQNPDAFKKLLWAMKRRNATASIDVANVMVAVDAAAAGVSSQDVAALLRDIRDELRQHNAVLQTLQAQQGASAPLAPSDAA